MAIYLVALLWAGYAVAAPMLAAYNKIRSDVAGLEILEMPLSLKLVELFLAIASVAIVTSVYSVLIQRGSLMSTTALYPRKPIEANLGSLLSLAWPDVSNDIPTPSKPRQAVQTQDTSAQAIKLFYLGKMAIDGH